MPKNTAPLPDWELVLSSAARLQRILPDRSDDYGMEP